MWALGHLVLHPSMRKTLTLLKIQMVSVLIASFYIGRQGTVRDTEAKLLDSRMCEYDKRREAHETPDILTNHSENTLFSPKIARNLAV